MAQQTVALGSAPNDGLGDGIRTGGDKINDNFDELYAQFAKVPINAQTGTTYTLALTDAGKLVDLTNSNSPGSAITVTIPLNATIAFATDTVVSFIVSGSGTVTIIGAGGVTVNGVSGGSVVIDGQYGVVTIVKKATNTWYAFGKIV